MKSSIMHSALKTKVDYTKQQWPKFNDLWGPPPLWTPPYLQPTSMWTPGHTLLSPPPVFTLIFKKGNISVCYGCKGNFAKQPAAPHDLVIQLQDYRMYTLPDGSVKHKYGNVYYHPAFSLGCFRGVLHLPIVQIYPPISVSEAAAPP